MPPESVTLADRYVLEAEIARGGMGTVWRARDEVLARPVAVKLLDPFLSRDEAFLERFRREALAAARLSHPNIVAIYDTGSESGSDGEELHYIVMELCAGGALADVLKREGAVEPRRVAWIGRATCDALDYAHRHHIVHRDVKPANILLTGDGTLKVGDFGIAKAAFAAGDLTTTGSVLGTVTYLSPEQANGDDPDHRSDIYALGIVLYELLTGRPPFVAETHLATAMMHIGEEPPPPRSLRAGIPRPLEDVILRALEKDPDRRWQSAAAMESALQDAAGAGADTVVLAPAPAARPAPDRPATAADTRWVLPVLAVIAVAVALAFALPAVLENGTPENGSRPNNRTGADGEDGSSQIEVQEVTDLDPHGDGSEHPERAPAAADGDPGSEWTTETYDDSFDLLGKAGVGLLFDLGEETEVTGVRVAGDPGTFELRAGNEEGPDETALEVFDEGDGATELSFDATSARYWLVWITDLPGGGGGRATISEVTFHGP